jgi:hypothetical protein
LSQQSGCVAKTSILLVSNVSSMTQHCQVCPIALEKCVDDMLQDLRDMEFYCAEYAAKEQPHIEGLLQVLHNGVGHLEVDMAKLRASGQNVTLHEQARRVLHRLVSCTNRRMHKGFPEMVSYILGKPHFMCSHDFVTVPFGSQFTHLMQELHRGMGLSTGPDEVQASLLEVAGTLDDGLGPSSQATCTDSVQKTQTKPFDYHWRHSTLESWPWFFFRPGPHLKPCTRKTRLSHGWRSGKLGFFRRMGTTHAVGQNRVNMRTAHHCVIQTIMQKSLYRKAANTNMTTTFASELKTLGWCQN